MGNQNLFNTLYELGIIATEDDLQQVKDAIKMDSPELPAPVVNEITAYHYNSKIVFKEEYEAFHDSYRKLWKQLYSLPVVKSWPTEQEIEEIGASYVDDYKSKDRERESHIDSFKAGVDYAKEFSLPAPKELKTEEDALKLANGVLAHLNSALQGDTPKMPPINDLAVMASNLKEKLKGAPKELKCQTCGKEIEGHGYCSKDCSEVAFFKETETGGIEKLKGGSNEQGGKKF